MLSAKMSSDSACSSLERPQRQPGLPAHRLACVEAIKCTFRRPMSSSRGLHHSVYWIQCLHDEVQTARVTHGRGHLHSIYTGSGQRSPRFPTSPPSLLPVAARPRHLLRRALWPPPAPQRPFRDAGPAARRPPAPARSWRPSATHTARMSFPARIFCPLAAHLGRTGGRSHFLGMR